MKVLIPELLLDLPFVDILSKRFNHSGYLYKMPKVRDDVRARDFDRPLVVHRLLEKKGLGVFKRIIYRVLCNTGDLFLDVTLEEYGYGNVEIPNFTAENTLELSELWVEAQTWPADYEHCRE